MPKPELISSSWVAKLQRRREFCERFVREHHPRMADASKIKGARPLVLLDGPNRVTSIIGSDWWLQTDNCISALGLVYVGYLFNRRQLLDHEWMVGRSNQEPWALVSEPYVPPATPENVSELRSELDALGVELIEYPTEESTHAPGQALMLVANVIDHYRLLGKVARLIAVSCGELPPAEEVKK